jgi:predicted nucleic acid-binding protein
MILVADASALIALAACDSLTPLEALFGNVLVPEAVFSEVTALDKPQSARLQNYLHGKVRVVDIMTYRNIIGSQHVSCDFRIKIEKPMREAEFIVTQNVVVA